MARRLEKDALRGAFARGPKPELGFLVPGTTPAEEAVSPPAPATSAAAAPAGEGQRKAAPRKRAARPRGTTARRRAPRAEPAAAIVEAVVQSTPAPVEAPEVSAAPPPALAEAPVPAPVRTGLPQGHEPSPLWSPSTPPYARTRGGLRARLERRWDRLVARVLRGAMLSGW